MSFIDRFRGQKTVSPYSPYLQLAGLGNVIAKANEPEKETALDSVDNLLEKFADTPFLTPEIKEITKQREQSAESVSRAKFTTTKREQLKAFGSYLTEKVISTMANPQSAAVQTILRHLNKNDLDYLLTLKVEGKQNDYKDGLNRGLNNLLTTISQNQHQLPFTPDSKQKKQLSSFDDDPFSKTGFYKMTDFGLVNLLENGHLKEPISRPKEKEVIQQQSQPPVSFEVKADKKVFEEDPFEKTGIFKITDSGLVNLLDPKNH